MNKVVVGLKLWENGNFLNQQMLTTLSLVFPFTSTQTKMTDEQILQLVKKYFNEGGIRDDGSCSEWFGDFDAFAKFASVVYSEGWAECKKCWDKHEIDWEDD
jgi:hypothetical protein